MPLESNEDRRRQQRRNVTSYLRIFDDATGDNLGHIVDISHTGMRVLSENPIEMGVSFSLRLDLSTVENFGNQLNFEAKTVWLEKEYLSEAYNCGLMLENIDGKTRELIEKLIWKIGV